jgi:hypothetical protein
MQWFRMHSDAVDDEKLRLLAFEDRWHFVALLCLKCQGLLDICDNSDLMRRKVAVKLGVQVRELEEIGRRLAEVGLVDQDTLQPLAWDRRQYKSDSSAERVRKHRESKRNQQHAEVKRACNVTVTPSYTDTDTDIYHAIERGQKRKRFVPPALYEVQAYIAEIGGSVDAGQWMDFYESKGWRVGKNPMKDWRACVRTWERRNAKDRQPSEQPHERRAREFREHKERVLGRQSDQGMGAAGRDVRGSVLEGVWERAE